MPSNTIIAKNATIRDVLSTLAQKDEFVRVVLGHLSECRKKHQNAFVRLGVTGQGKFPSHKIVYDDSAGKEVFFKAWDGNTEFSGVKIHDDTWSGARMSLDEVSALLGEIRSFKPAGRKV